MEPAFAALLGAYAAQMGFGLPSIGGKDSMSGTFNDIDVPPTCLLYTSTPVIWRGPVLANMVKQFWTDVIWGDVDYLFVDMPPGTCLLYTSRCV